MPKKNHQVSTSLKTGTTRKTPVLAVLQSESSQEVSRGLTMSHSAKKASKPIIQRPVIDQLPDDAFLRLPQVLAVWPISKASWYRGIAEGKYPKSVQISDNTVAWRVGDIRALLESATNKGAA